MEIRTIKNVDRETWKEFKELAEKNKTTMGSLLKSMISNFENNSQRSWDNILYKEKNLSEKEAEKILEITKKLRKEYGFRK